MVSWFDLSDYRERLWPPLRFGFPDFPELGDDPGPDYLIAFVALGDGALQILLGGAFCVLAVRCDQHGRDAAQFPPCDNWLNIKRFRHGNTYALFIHLAIYNTSLELQIIGGRSRS